MSDSPLDGGSGWPTSAYAIVPRPANPGTTQSPPDGIAQGSNKPGGAKEPREPGGAQEPREPGGAKALTEPGGAKELRRAGAQPHADEQTRTGEADDTDTHGRHRRVALAVGALVFVLAIGIAIAGAVRAVGDASTAPDRAAGTQAAAAQPEASATRTGETGQGSGTGMPGPTNGAVPNPSAGTTAPGTAASGAPAVLESAGTDALRSGTVRLAVIAGRPEEAFDLDAGAKQATGADVTAAAIGLQAANGARFAPWTRPGRPTAAACAATPEAQWSTTVLLAALLPGSTTCVRTSEGRFAAVAARASDALTEGQIYVTYLDFTVWKKAGD